MNEQSTSEQVRTLTLNLASLWNGGRDILDRLVAAAGDPEVSPYAAYMRLGAEGVDVAFADAAQQAAVTAAYRELTRYMEGETWFDRARKGDTGLARLAGHPVAYICMEYGLASWLPIYSGGLGILAGDMLKEASDMGLPMAAVGLLYRHGFFYQQLDENRYQTERIPSLDPAQLPVEEALDPSGHPVIVYVPIEDREVAVKVWKLQVGRVPLYLLDTCIPENDRADDRTITESLYGGNETTRIQQEIVLGIGGVRALHALGIDPAIYSMNEGHAAFLGFELIEEVLPDSTLDEAVRDTRSRIVYTNHTVVPAGNDQFPRDLVRRFLARFAEQCGLTMDQILDLGTRGADDWFQMAVLAFNLSGKANAVSELHAQVIPREWPGYSVQAVTNGVHVPTWLGPEMRALLTRYVPDWQSDTPTWDAIRSIPDAELLQARNAQRARLVQFASSRDVRARLDPDALTLVWARRFAEYKRAWLVASDLERLRRLLTNRERPAQLVISGKSHPRDEGGKRMLQDLLRCLDEDSEISPHVVFIENYDEQVARYLTMGADVWLNTPRKPLEASGTSGMKSSDNGGLQLTVTDGWANEVDWWGVGWGIQGRDDNADAADLYGFLESSVVPTFFRRDADGLARDWAAMVKNTMIVTLSRYSTRRMALDYVHKLYLPLLTEQPAAAGAR